ncbi:DMT family transporter [Streptomyces sp. CRN 30]|uniref:DMT family transporter n=1 Tax=Streptomyces sp. CRN 30 TaxID=3075613 RepID=UPI002A8227AD|nr:SMR family transporter [Streptomyces sp. CRN 30]
MAGLAYAMGSLPVGTAYAVWAGIGAVLTVMIAAARGQDRLTPLRAALLAGLIGCVIGLKAVS